MTPEQLFEKHQRLVGWVIATRYPVYANDEDMRQIGSIGLWMACNKFEPVLGYKFSTFAVHCITCEIGRELWSQQYKKRKPTDPTVSLDEPLHHCSDITLGETIPCGAGWENKVVMRIDLYRAIGKLPQDGRVTVTDMLAGATQDEIALRYGITNKGVSYRYRKAQKRLAELMV